MDGAWLTSQLQARAPTRTQGAAEALQIVRELARACAALEARRGPVFGEAIDHVCGTGFVVQLRVQLAEWRIVIDEKFGEDGQLAFDQVCEAAGVVLDPLFDEPTDDDSVVDEVAAVRAAPANRVAIRGLAAKYPRFAEHLTRALELETLRLDDPRRYTLARQVTEGANERRAALTKLVWPRELAKVGENASFVRGLPVACELDANTLQTYRDAAWAQAPIARTILRFGPRDDVDELAASPAIARATELELFAVHAPDADFAPLLARPGAVLERLRMPWHPTSIRQLRALPAPAGLRSLSLADAFEGERANVLRESDIDELATLLPGVTAFALANLKPHADALRALEHTGWALDHFAIELPAINAPFAELATSPAMRSVRRLELGAKQLTGVAATALATSPMFAELLVLELGTCAGLAAWLRSCTFANLVALTLRGPDLAYEAFEAFAANRVFERLLSLSFASASVTDKAATVLASASLPSLRHLTIPWHQLSAAGIKALRDAPWAPQLETFAVLERS